METDFSSWLAVQLRERGWRQRDLAEAIGVTQQTASRWLLGQTSPSGVHTLALARAFGLAGDEVVARLEQALERPKPTSRSRDGELDRLRARVAQLEAELRRRA